MNIDELIICVNDKLKNGYSIKKIENELNYGKDTLRKKLNRANYFYNKIKNQFILEYNTPVTRGITQPLNTSITQNITHDKPSSTNEKNNTEKNTNQKRAFTDNDFNTLFEIIDFYKSNKNIIKVQNNIQENKPEIDTKNKINIPSDSEVTTRSFRSYKKVFDDFSEYCKSNNLNQKDAIASALLNFISE